ncbi:MAG: serine/threonine-protein kinase [Acidobacteriota bacterium]
MTATTWRRARRIFEASLDRPTAVRSRFVEQAAGGDRALHADVRELLRAHRAAEGRLPEPWPSRGSPEAPPLAAGDRVGAYSVVRELGRGGMGWVFLAERADQAFQKLVAIKLVSPGAILPEVFDHLLEERHILAQLEHPNVARLLDGGSTENGLPYLVMEYVAGIPIDRFCRDWNLPIEARIGLFRQVCEAVHFAHQNLIIHRDIKPGNILVTSTGTAKLLDFGLARWTRRQPIEAPRRALRPLTPEYASPEQLRGEPLSTATDIFSLGVLLYELLTDRRLFRGESSSHGLVKYLSRGTPIQPSVALDPPSPAAGSRDGPQGLSNRLLSRRLAGDLDHIVLCALQEKPAERYPSVQRLSDDLQRHLDHLPVSARGHTAVYRSVKFIRRHKALVAIVGIAVLVLSFSTGLLAVQQRRLVAERDVSQAALTRAETVERFTVELFTEADPAMAGSSYFRLREGMLDAGVRRIRSELASQPEVRASLMTQIGAAYGRMGLFDKALPLLRDAHALRIAVLPEGHPDLAESQLELGSLWADQSRFAKADLMLRRALKWTVRASGPESPEVADCLHELAQLTRDRGDRAAAEPMLRRALELRRRWLGDDHPKVAESLRGLGDWAWDESDGSAAEGYWKEALEINRKSLGPHHPSVAAGLADLAYAASLRGDQEESEVLFLEGLELGREVFGENHSQLARILYGLAWIDQHRGHLATAEERYRQVLAMNRSLFDGDHVHIAGSLNALARVHQAQGRFALAESMFQEALAMNQRLVGDDHGHIAITLLFLAELYSAQGEWQKAEPLLQRALPMARRAFVEDHRMVARLEYRLAEVWVESGRVADAELLARRAIASLEKAFPPQAPSLLEARRILERCIQASA